MRYRHSGRSVARIRSRSGPFSSASGLDLDRVAWRELLLHGEGRENVRPPLDRPARRTEPRLNPEEVALELDLHAELLECFACDTCLERLAGIDAAARGPPDPRRVGRLADEREPVAVEDEER